MDTCFTHLSTVHSNKLIVNEVTDTSLVNNTHSHCIVLDK